MHSDSPSRQRRKQYLRRADARLSVAMSDTAGGTVVVSGTDGIAQLFTVPFFNSPCLAEPWPSNCYLVACPAIARMAAVGAQSGRSQSGRLWNDRKWAQSGQCDASGNAPRVNAALRIATR